MKIKLFAALLALCLALASCGARDSVHNLLASALSRNESLPAGSVKFSDADDAAENFLSEDFLCDYLFLKELDGEAQKKFLAAVEEAAIYSSARMYVSELAIFRMYSCSDVNDMARFLLKRIDAAKNLAAKDENYGNAAEYAEVKIFGRTVALFMLDDNESAKEILAKAKL